MGTSKLSSFRDGWRHLRFLLVHSPFFLFIVPGALQCLLGLLASVTVLTGVRLFGRHWYMHTLIGGSLLIVVGVQVLALGICARAYGMYYLGEDAHGVRRCGAGSVSSTGSPWGRRSR